MNIQQLRYIVAIDRFRNFARAADSCHISQPTLSAMVAKLEKELDVRLFERSNKTVKPTVAGEKIIRQAQRALMETDRIAELASEDKGTIGGSFALSVGPTIAPYLLPKFIHHYRNDYPTVDLSIRELKASFMLRHSSTESSTRASPSPTTSDKAYWKYHSTQNDSMYT